MRSRKSVKVLSSGVRFMVRYPFAAFQPEPRRVESFCRVFVAEFLEFLPFLQLLCSCCSGECSSESSECSSECVERVSKSVRASRSSESIEGSIDRVDRSSVDRRFVLYDGKFLR